ncbi:MAG: hypothetical protein HKL99_12180 [Burkholderiales bacterium]|nr:hypothetical protein [Burkholderiales bacterium]
MTIRTIVTGAVVVAGLTLSSVPVLAQQQAPQQHSEIAPAAAANAPEGNEVKYTNAELIPLTVHQAWLKSGKSEDVFFDMVTQLAELSAQNRNLELPQTAAAGRRVGEMIKLMAKEDTDQLLYAVVDAAVRKVGTPLPAVAPAK